jgi:hypothetical protein
VEKSNNLFTCTSPEISDDGSVYNDSGDKSSISDTVDKIDSDDEDSTGSLESLQKLYTVFCIPTRGSRYRK